MTLQAYLVSGTFMVATFQNWESEFLQMGVLVLLTAYLRQKGSPKIEATQSGRRRGYRGSCGPHKRALARAQGRYHRAALRFLVPSSLRNLAKRIPLRGRPCSTWHISTGAWITQDRSRSRHRIRRPGAEPRRLPRCLVRRIVDAQLWLGRTGAPCPWHRILASADAHGHGQSLPRPTALQLRLLCRPRPVFATQPLQRRPTWPASATNRCLLCFRPWGRRVSEFLESQRRRTVAQPIDRSTTSAPHGSTKRTFELSELVIGAALALMVLG